MISNLQLLCIILLIELLFNLWLFKGDLLAPSIIFCFMFLVAAIDLLFMIDYWAISLGKLTVIVVGSGVFAFSLGSLLAKRNNIKFVFRKSKRKYDKILKVEISNLSLDLWIVLAFLTIVIYIVNNLKVIGMSFSLGNILMTYVMNSNQLENDTTPFYISILSLMVTSLSYIGGYLFAVNRILYKEKNIRYVLGILVSCIYFFLCTKRGNFIMYIVSLLYLILLVANNGKNIKITRRVYIVTVILGGILIAAFPTLGTLFGRTTVVTNSFEYISIYLGAPLLNLDYALKHGGVSNNLPLAYTFRMFYDFLYRYTGNSDYYIESPNEFIYANRHTTGNVYTTFSDFYYDGQVFAVIGMTVVMAYITQSMYTKIKKDNLKNSIFYYVLYSYIYGLIFRSFFANSFYAAIQPSIIEIVIIWWFFAYFIKKIRLKEL